MNERTFGTFTPRAKAAAAVALLLHCMAAVSCDRQVGSDPAASKLVVSASTAAANTSGAAPTAAGQTAIDGSWPAWRGPTADGKAAPAGLPKNWAAGKLTQRWFVPLGTGWSSPVVAEGLVFITDRQRDRERLLAIEAATGRIAWTTEHPVDFDPHAVGRRHGNGPKATPAVSDAKVYSLGITGWLECRNVADGKLVWEASLPAAFGRRESLAGGRAFVDGTSAVIVPVGDGQGAPVPLFGYTGSPLVVDGLVICSVGGEQGGTIMAFDAQTGAVRWKALDENVSYSSPVAATLGGVKQIVAMTGPRVVGLAADDGRLLWSHPFQIQYDESISTPVIAGELVLVTGDGKPLTALKIERVGNELRSSVAWTNRVLSSYLSTMLVDGEYVYGMNDGGEFACVRLADGETVWADGSLGYYMSPVLAGSEFVGLNEKGILHVVRRDPSEYALSAQQRLVDAETWTVPAIVGRWLFIRSAEGLHAFEHTGD